jgi:transcription termination factor Rho
MDELIYEEFKGTGNLEVHLVRKLAEKRVFPAIDVMKSGTRQEELLYDKKIYPMIVKLRRMLGLLDDDERTELLLEKLRKSKDNEEFLKNIDKAG